MSQLTPAEQKALELSEGFEEGFQGIMSERGQEVAKMILQKGYNQRTLESYLKDGEIWEQAFWGAFGGVVFGAAGKGVGSIKNKIENKINNKDIVDESKRQYSSYDEMTKASINNRLNKMQQVVEQLTQIDVDNVLPEGYNNRYEVDENGKVILVNATLDEKLCQYPDVYANLRPFGLLGSVCDFVGLLNWCIPGANSIVGVTDETGETKIIEQDFSPLEQVELRMLYNVRLPRSYAIFLHQFNVVDFRDKIV